jgi:hypothetical protein
MPDKVNTRISSLSLVRYKNNDYSTPTRYGHQEVNYLIAGFFAERTSNDPPPCRNRPHAARMPNRFAASLRLSPSIITARLTLA